MQEMTYEQAVQYLDRIPKFSPRSIANGTEPYNLTAISELLRRLGNPQDQLKFVHIAGTNGKGSTAAFLSNILAESGYRVGVYSSPHLVEYTERMRILDAGRAEYDISGDDLGFLTGIVKERAENMKMEGEQYPSEFEIICAMAFLYFLEQEVDVVVLETGLGGRLDATNVINTPDLAILTTISYDHMEILGDSLDRIAYEKAGIIKENGDIIMYPQAPEAEAVFDNVCKERKAWLHRAILPGKLNEIGLKGISFDLPGLKNLEICTPGIYQAGNAALAVGAAKILYTRGYDNITDDAMRAGLKKTHIPARFELLYENPFVFVDGSHNEEGAMVLSRSLEAQFGEEKKIIFVVGVLADKEYDRMIGQVTPLAKKFFTITPPSGRALPAAELAQFIHTATGLTATPCNTVNTAIRMAMSQAAEDDVICIFGSLYYVGEARAILGDLRKRAEEMKPSGSVGENRAARAEELSEEDDGFYEEEAPKPKKKKKGLFSFFRK